MKKNRLLNYDWDAIAGILAAVIAIILHLLHVIDENIILPVVLTLMALLFINFIRHTQNNERTAEQVENIQNTLTKLEASLTAPDIILIGPRDLRQANMQFIQHMQGEAILFNVCLSMYRTQPLFDTLLRPIIENPHVTNVQLVLDISQKSVWQTEVQPKVDRSLAAGKVKKPCWCALEKNISFIMADAKPNGQTEALVSFWGEPFMSQSTERNVPRYILHVQGHSELLTRLVELERHCQINHGEAIN